MRSKLFLLTRCFAFALHNLFRTILVEDSVKSKSKGPKGFGQSSIRIMVPEVALIGSFLICQAGNQGRLCIFSSSSRTDMPHIRLETICTVLQKRRRKMGRRPVCFILDASVGKTINYVHSGQFLRWYNKHLVLASHHNPEVGAAFWVVAQALRPATDLFKLHILWPVLLQALKSDPTKADLL